MRPLMHTNLKEGINIMTKINEKQFNTALKAIKANSETLAQSIHEAGIFSLVQVNTHGNWDFGKRLIEAMGKAHRAESVKQWLRFYGKFGVKDGILVYRKRTDIKPENLDAWIAKAEACPFWEFAPEQKTKESIDLITRLESIVKFLDAIPTKEAKGIHVTVHNIGVLDDIKATLAKFNKPVIVEQQLITL